MAAIRWPYDRQYYEMAGSIVSNVLKAIYEKRYEEFGLPRWMISQRMKTDASIEEKIRRKQAAKPGYSVASISDLIGVRAIVDSIHTSAKLAEFIRKRATFVVREGDSEDFVQRPRADGYRGIHLILDVEVALASTVRVPVELQIRTILQHQWSELSHSEFYKSVAEIPPLMLNRMRSLSDILHCADMESEELRRARILDTCRNVLSTLLRQQVFERLGSGLSGSEVPMVGNIGNILVEFDKQLRRVLVSEGIDQYLAFEALQVLRRDLAELDNGLSGSLEEIEGKVRAFVEEIPTDW